MKIERYPTFKRLQDLEALVEKPGKPSCAAIGDVATSSTLQGAHFIRTLEGQAMCEGAMDRTAKWRETNRKIVHRPSVVRSIVYHHSPASETCGIKD